MANAYRWGTTIYANVHQDFLDSVVKMQIHACQILVELVNASNKETPLFVNAHKDFLDSVVRIKCKPIHAYQILVKTEESVQHSQVVAMEWPVVLLIVNVHQALLANVVK